MQELQRSRQVAITALHKLRGIVKSFVSSPRVLTQVDNIVVKAMRDMGLEEKDIARIGP